jgi:hypothetical protein
VTTQIPPIRLTRAGKGTTFCRTRKREGRMTVSAPDLRRSNRLRPRRYANSDRTRLWIGRTSGHGSGVFVEQSDVRRRPRARRVNRARLTILACGSALPRVPPHLGKVGQSWDLGRGVATGPGFLRAPKWGKVTECIWQLVRSRLTGEWWKTDNSPQDSICRAQAVIHPCLPAPCFGRYAK